MLRKTSSRRGPGHVPDLWRDEAGETTAPEDPNGYFDPALVYEDGDETDQCYVHPRRALQVDDPFRIQYVREAGFDSSFNLQHSDMNLHSTVLGSYHDSPSMPLMPSLSGTPQTPQTPQTLSTEQTENSPF